MTLLVVGNKDLFQMGLLSILFFYKKKFCAKTNMFAKAYPSLLKK